MNSYFVIIKQKTMKTSDVDVPTDMSYSIVYSGGFLVNQI